MTDKKSNGYWNDREKCRTAAAVCDTVSQFSKLYPSAYNSAKKNNWLYGEDGFFERKQVRHTIESVTKDALQCYTRWEFQQSFPKSYKAAKRNGWLDAVCGHMSTARENWTHFRIHEEALKYKNRRDFRHHSSKAYWAAKSKGILNAVCSHMVPLGNKYKRFVYEIHSICGKYVYVGLSVNPKHRFEQHRCSGPCVEIIKNGASMSVVSELLSAQDARLLEIELIRNYSNRSVIVLNSAKGGSLGWGVRKHSVRSIKVLSSLCKTRTEFAKTYPNEYAAARRNGWLDKVCEHMSERKQC